MPALQLDPQSFMQRMSQGALTVAVPMVAGTRIGDVSVRPDTRAAVTLAITNGRLDFERTQITFERSDGSNTSLDGPLWIDPSRFYIDSDGTIRADVPCWPDPNITEAVLGEGNNRVPDDPEEFVRLLTAQAAQGGTVALTPGVHVDAASGRVDLRHVDEPEAAGEPNPLSDALNFSALEVEFSGSLTAGPLRLGDGTLLNLGPGTTITATGTMRNMRAHLDAPIRSFHMAADGTTLRTGAGRMGVDLTYREGEALQVEVRNFELNDVRLEAPAERGRRHSLRWERLAVTGAEGEPALMSTRVGEGAPPGMQVHLPQVDLSSVAAQLHLLGGDGRPAELTLGARPNSDDAPMSITGQLELDTGAQSFRLVTQVENHQARLSSVALDSAHFDLRTREASLTGSGRVEVMSRGGQTTLDIQATDPENPIEARVEVDDAFIGPRHGHGFTADLAAGSSSTLQLTQLSLVPGEHPVLAGSAQLEVTLDSLHLPGGEALDLNLQPGTRGLLQLHDMGWERGATSPHMRATLELDLGIDALFDPSRMPGMEGVSARVDTDTGRTRLLIEGRLHPDGRLDLAGNLHVRGARMQGTRVTGRVHTPPPVEIPARPLGPMTSVPLRPRRTPVSVSAEDPPAPAVSFVPGEFLGEVDRATLSASIRLRPTTLGPVGRSFAWRGVRMGANLTVRVPDAPLGVSVGIRDGTVVPNLSRLIVNPGIQLSLGAEGGVASFSARGTVATATITELRLERDRNGRIRIIPEINWISEDRLPSWLPQVELDGWVEKLAGEWLARLLVNADTLPADLGELAQALENVYPAMGGPVTINAGDDDAGSAMEVLNRHVDTNRSQLQLAGAALNPQQTTRLDLGDGQFIELLPGSTVNVLVSGDSYQITGHAQLGQVRVGHDQIGAELGGGEADISLVVQRSPDGGPPEVRLHISELSATDFAAVGARAGVGHSQVRVQRVTRGQLDLLWRQGETPHIRAHIPPTRGALSLEGRVALQDGTEIILSRARANELTLAFGETTEVWLEGLSAHAEGTFQLPPLPGQDGHPVLDVRGASIRGSLRANEHGVDAGSDISLTQVDASLYCLPINTGEGFDVRFGQIDLHGDFAVTTNDAGWAIEAVGEAREGEYTARAVADRFQFETDEPNLRMNAPNSQFLLNLRRLEFNKQGVEMTVEGGQFDGQLQAGSVRVQRGGDGGVLETLQLDRGTRIHGELPYLVVGGDHPRLDTTIRMEGRFREGATNLGGDAATGVEHRAAELEGSARLVARSVVTGPDDMGINIKLLLDADAHWEGSITVPTPDVRVP